MRQRLKPTYVVSARYKKERNHPELSGVNIKAVLISYTSDLSSVSAFFRNSAGALRVLNILSPVFLRVFECILNRKLKVCFYSEKSHAARLAIRNQHFASRHFGHTPTSCHTHLRVEASLKFCRHSVNITLTDL